VLTLQFDGVSDFAAQHPDQYAALVEYSVFVNSRPVEARHGQSSLSRSGSRASLRQGSALSERPPMHSWRSVALPRLCFADRRAEKFVQVGLRVARPVVELNPAASRRLLVGEVEGDPDVGREGLADGLHHLVISIASEVPTIAVDVTVIAA
jgi:hypothetical protein